MAQTYGRNDPIAPTDIEWGDPPEAGSRKVGVWVQRLAPFKERPGKWGKLPGYWLSPVAASIKKGEYNGVEAGEFEATTRVPKADGGKNAPPKNKVEIWVRYVGEGASESNH